MKPKLSRWAGLAAILGGILWLGFFTLQATAPAALDREPYTVTNPVAYVIYNLMFLFAVLLFVTSLLGLYSRQAECAGPAGKIGVILALAGGLLFITGGVLSSLFNIDGMWYVMMAGAAVLPFSLIALGAATLRTQVLGRWSLVPLAVGALSIAAFLSGFLGIVEAEQLGMWIGIALTALMGIGWVLLGYALAVGRPGESASTELHIA